MANEQSSNDDFSLKEWALKARITRENTNSRRFSASNLRSSFRDHHDHATSFRSNVTVSSEVQSIIGRSPFRVYTWEHQSGGDGLTLNSKWNEAEKYICNPLSGEVPLECLSAKTLSGRSFRRITMSAPLIYPSHMHQFHPKPPISEFDTASNEKTTRDVGMQSTPLDLSSGSPSPARTPSIRERPRKSGDSDTVYSDKLKSETTEVEERERDERESIKIGGEKKKEMMMWNCSRKREDRGAGGCLSLKGLWRRAVLRHRDKHKSRKTIPCTHLPFYAIFILNLKSINILSLFLRFSIPNYLLLNLIHYSILTHFISVLNY